MISFGIMQGRLTPSQGKGIQFFPFDHWEKEFELGAMIGINEVEWIFDYDRFEDNPLWSCDRTQLVKEVISSSGINVRSVCFDYFMRRPFYKYRGDEKKHIQEENIEFVKRIIDSMHELGSSLLEIPMVDDSSVKTAEEKKFAIEFLHKVLRIAKPAGIFIGCETDMPVGVFREFLESVNDEWICANYDSGNSSGLGYDHEDEIHSLSEYIANVHIKDRVFYGTTVELGTGSADFDKVFSSLKEVGYSKSIILQAARGKDGNEMENIRSQLDFVKEYCRKYDLG
ncbi:MAG: sugar phosphate isomerase/epimerase [Hungatella sp.]|jgi:hexulose-6-phosphate isomerase|nr:sugar phosphate isomerase/epimerase [Hungatella sp.]